MVAYGPREYGYTPGTCTRNISTQHHSQRTAKGQQLDEYCYYVALVLLKQQ
jgi:hypothetical protein